MINLGEHKTLKCPFCKEGDIEIIHNPDTYTTQTIRVGSNRKTIPKLMKGIDTVLSKECPNCHEKKSKIEKALKEGVKPSLEEAAKRAKEAGLPLKF